MINYQLKSKEKIKPQPVNAYITGCFTPKSQQLKIAVGKSVLPEYFGDEKDRFRYNRDKINRSKLPIVMQFKNTLERFEDIVNRTEFYFNSLGYVPNVDEFKDKLLVNLGRKVDVFESIRLVDFLHDYCNELRDLMIRGQKKIKESSIVQYEELLTQIINYEDVKRKKLMVHDISFDVYQDFIHVTNEIFIGNLLPKNDNALKRKKFFGKRGYSVNSLSNLTSRFKNMLKQARIRGFELHMRPTSNSFNQDSVMGDTSQLYSIVASAVKDGSFAGTSKGTEQGQVRASTNRQIQKRTTF
ncbi:hypothetical protein [Empedobacter brevis]|uniref:hypothetical protein n=1 Tax=Empedobacter brevis TaxID=247 RepID=UPI0028D6A9D7|nr:hypothetical protein [Empedobacter brevis]